MRGSVRSPPFLARGFLNQRFTKIVLDEPSFNCNRRLIQRDALAAAGDCRAAEL
jgi:hypothetical protein